MSVSEIAHSGRYVINFYFSKGRRTYYSYPGSRIAVTSREEAKKCEAHIRAKLIASTKAAPLPINITLTNSFFRYSATKGNPPPSASLLQCLGFAFSNAISFSSYRIMSRA